MALKTEVSLGMAAATAGLVFTIFQRATPSIADIRVGEPNNDHIASAERQAAYAATGAVAAISLVAKDATIFIIGGGMTIAMIWWTRHANAVNPVTGFASMASDARRVTLNAVPNEDVTGDDDFAEAYG